MKTGRKLLSREARKKNTICSRRSGRKDGKDAKSQINIKKLNCLLGAR